MDHIGKVATAVQSPQPLMPASPICAKQQLETASHAKILLGWCDPKEASDPDIFVRSLELLLSVYPLDVQRIVVDPRSAVLERIKRAARQEREWVSFIELVRRSCEDIYGPTRRRIEREAVVKLQLEEREAVEAARAAAPTAAKLKEKYGPNYGLTPLPEIDPDSELAAKLRRTEHYGLRCIEREYAAHGEEPRLSGGMLISRSLAENIRQKREAQRDLGPSEER